MIDAATVGKCNNPAATTAATTTATTAATATTTAATTAVGRCEALI